MRLLQIQADGDFNLVEYVGNHIPRYAILSHTWGVEDEEVTYRDIMGGIGKDKVGYRKLTFCGRRAANDGLQFFWVDTCCIDKSSSSELTEAINSMFRWYKSAAKCYVYLSDVSTSNFTRDIQCFRESRWFTRGWTLQELLAPSFVEFFSQEGNLLGDRESLIIHITEATSIPIEAFQGIALHQFSIEARMSWLGKRETKRNEDAAYCLLGLFNVYMPLIYGEGRVNAFIRLWEEIAKPFRNWPLGVSLQQPHLEPSSRSHRPFSAISRVLNLDSTERSTIPISPNIYEGSGVSFNSLDHNFKTNKLRRRVSATDRKTVTNSDDWEENIDLEAIFKEFFWHAGQTIDSNEGRASQLHNVPKSYDETTVNKLDLIGRNTGTKNKVVIPKPLHDLSGATRDKAMPQNTTDLMHSLQNFMGPDIDINAEQLQYHINNANTREILNLLLGIRHVTGPGSQKIVNDWLGVTKFDEKYDIASYYDKQVSACLQETCKWIFTYPAYKEWALKKYQDEVARVLWICAPPGYGKTVLCAQLVEHLKGTGLSSLVYFFASPHAQAGGEPSFVIRYWIARMAQLNSDVLELVLQHSKAGHRASDSVIWPLLRTIVSEVCSFTFVLDGFDEYRRDNNTRSNFLQKLKKTTNRTSSRILITSRIETDIEAELFPSKAKEAGYVRLQCKITEQDVRADVSLLSKSIVDKKLSRKDARLRQEVAEKLTEKCEGMFLWIVLQQDQLRSGKNAKQLHRIVNNMPVGLDQTYERNWGVIQKLSTEDKKRALAILEWTTHTFRPLTVAEITVALIVECNNGVATIQWDELPEEIDEEYINSEIIDICGGLVETRAAIPKGTARMRTVHLIHSSVQEFLFRTLSSGSLDTVQPCYGSTEISTRAEQHKRLATVCITYLDHEQAWQQSMNQNNSEKSWGFIDYAAKYWNSHTTVAGPDRTELVCLIKNFLCAKNKSFKLWQKYIDANVISPDAPQQEVTATPLYYAALFNFPKVVEYILTQDATQLDKIGGKYGTPLQAACVKGHEPTFKILLDSGADPNIEGGEFGVPINAAINEGHQNIVKILLGNDVNHTLKDHAGRTPLYTAAMNGNHEAMCWLIASGAEKETPNNDGWTPLNTTAQRGHLEIVKLLLEKGADLTVPNNDGWTPLNNAASSGHLEIVKLLLEKGADLTVPNNDGWTPLNNAASGGHLEIVKLLLEKGTDLTVPNKDGATPIFTAALSGHLEVVRLLLDKGADLAVPNNNGWTPLNNAAYSGHLEIIKLLLEKGADLAVPNNHGATPIYTAVFSGHLEVVRLLLEKGADLAVPNNNGWTPLNNATYSGHLEVVKLLLENGADLTVPNNNGWTPLNTAASSGHLEIVKLLLENGANLTVPNNNGWTPLNNAAYNGHLETVKLLLEKGADLTVPSNGSWTPLDNAVYSGHLEIVKLLLQKGADLTVSNKNGATQIYIATLNGHLEVVRVLLKNGADLTVPNNDGWTPLNNAASSGHLEIVELLLENGADLMVPNNDGWTPLNNAASGGHLEIVKLLLEKGADLAVPNKDGATPIFTAALSGHLEVVRLLLEKEADLAVPNNNGWTTLNNSVSSGHLEIVKLLLEKGADLEVPNNDGWTPLNNAVYRGYLEIVKLLLQKGADLTVSNKNGATPVYIATLNGHLEIVRLLLEKGADLTVPNNIGWTPLNHAASSGHLEIFKLLLQNGADFTVPNNDGWTPLNNAAYGGHLEIVKLLLEKGIDVTVPNNDGWTPLNNAVYSGHLEIVKLLLEKGADLTVPNKDGATPIFTAALGGHLEVLRLLLEKGADLAVPTNNGWTPLNSAASSGHLEIVKLLLEKGADLTVPNNIGWTPLLIAAENGQLEVVKFLLENGSDANSCHHSCGFFLNILAFKGHTDLLRLACEQYNANLHLMDTHGRGPLQLAARGGHYDTFQFLISQNLNLMSKDASGDGLLRYASSGGSVQIINAVLSMNSIVSSHSNHWSPLHWACRAGNSDAVERLIQEGVHTEFITTSPQDGRWDPSSIAHYHGNQEMLEKLTVPSRSLLAAESDTIQLRGGRHEGFSCNGCLHDIYGPRFYCRTCVNFDYCFMCKPLFDHLHTNHEWDFFETHT